MLDRLNGVPARTRVTKEIAVQLDFTVHQYGTDTSGRAILATAAFEKAFQAALADPRLDSFRSKIVTVQGAFMARLGGGAAASAGYHDAAGCRDVRTWNLTLAEQAVLWIVMDDYGIRFWKRDLSAAHGGMDEHGHGIAVWDRPLASGAVYQASQARATPPRDGLASNRPDYMPRKHPVLTEPPAWIFEEMTMDAEVTKAFEKVNGKLDELAADLNTFRENEWKRDRAAAVKARESKKALVTKLGGLADQLTELANDASDDATKQQVQALRSSILTALADDPDVDGPDNPAPTEQ